MRIPLAFALALGLATFAASASAAHETALFDSEEAIAVTLIGPFSAIARDKAADPAPRDGTLVWTDAAGQEHRIAVGLSPRGISRRNPDACRFPPIRIEFAKDVAGGTPFANLKKVKLVTHCTFFGDPDRSHAERLWLEFLVYRAFNRLTDTSFRVRPLAVTYIDTTLGNRK